MNRPARSVLAFVAIGLALYALAYWGAERLLYRTGDSNALYKIATAEPAYDWVILGASHAMPLDFADFNAMMERETGLRILNLAAPGTGPLYQRFVLERFLAHHRAANVLYVLDAFAFSSAQWNEERFADAKLLRRTPFRFGTARHLLAYCLREGVPLTAWLDYVSGFSKLNNRERFQRDVWEGEAQFERSQRPSARADRKRIAYLYPAEPDPAALPRYLHVFATLLHRAEQAGLHVVVLKLPVPPAFHGALPGEAEFDGRVRRMLHARGLALRDFSLAEPNPRHYFDTDHLNRTGLTAFFAQHLRPILLSPAAPPASTRP